MNMLELIISTAIAEAGDYCDVRLPRDVAEQILVVLQTQNQERAELYALQTNCSNMA